ncbi:MAG: hypothetical protein ACD_37C00164G0002 [uncultured bacterium]|nr:MAG: hypothetical protein ACD_37C00164G0002 [uncultured bacterium]
MNRTLKLIISIIICEGIGILGSLFTFSEITTWYIGLNKPFFSPPNFVFGPVWTVLYALMGISVVLALEKTPKTRSAPFSLTQGKSSGQEKRNLIISLFAFQLFLNFLWSVVFFTGHQPVLA